MPLCWLSSFRFGEASRALMESIPSSPTSCCPSKGGFVLVPYCFLLPNNSLSSALLHSCRILPLKSVPVRPFNFNPLVMNRFTLRLTPASTVRPTLWFGYTHPHCSLMMLAIRQVDKARTSVPVPTNAVFCYTVYISVDLVEIVPDKHGDPK
jgi:hypothetical protein